MINNNVHLVYIQNTCVSSNPDVDRGADEVSSWLFVGVTKQTDVNALKPNVLARYKMILNTINKVNEMHIESVLLSTADTQQLRLSLCHLCLKLTQTQ